MCTFAKVTLILFTLSNRFVFRSIQYSVLIVRHLDLKRWPVHLNFHYILKKFHFCDLIPTGETGDAFRGEEYLAIPVCSVSARNH